MFASFQITGEGLTQAEPRPKLVRSDDGCLPCRRKRKRCDKTKPACIRCRNSTNRDVCTWPEITKTRRTTLDEGTNTPIRTDTDGSAYHEDDEWFTDGACELPSLSLYKLGSLEPYRLPDAVTHISPDLSFPKFLRLTLAFQRKVLCRESEYAGSFFLLGIPGTSCSSALSNAWVAASLAATAPETGHWQHKALMHHSQALLDLRKGLGNEDLSGRDTGEWMRATVLMLHIFESLASHNYRSNLAVSHLNAAHRIFGDSVRRAYPQNVHDCMLHDAYILRTTVNCLFRPKADSPITYADELLKHLTISLELLGLKPSLQTCPWTGQTGHDLVNKIYRLSWLAHRVPLRGKNTFEVLKIHGSLGQWTPPTFNEIGVPGDAVRWVTSIATLFWHACSLLCSLLITTIQGTDSTMSQELHFQEGTKLLDKLSQEDRIKAALTWPFIVLGLVCPDSDQLRLYERISHRITTSAGKEVVARARTAVNEMYALRTKTTGAVSAVQWIQLVEAQELFI